MKKLRSYLMKLLRSLSIVLLFCLIFFKPHASLAEGTYANIGTSTGSNAGSDAISWSQASPIMIDNFGNYIVPIENNGGTYTWAVSTNKGSTWTEISSTLSFRPSAVYNTLDDTISVLTEPNNRAVYSRFKIKRDSNYNITDIISDPTFTDLTLDNIGSCSSATFGSYPIILFKTDNSHGKIVAIWDVKKTCSGSTVTQTRASMLTLTNTASDGTASNWKALNGSSDAGSTIGPAAVDFNVLYSYSGAATHIFQHSALIKGGSDSKSNDLYYFNIDENDTNGFRRLSWNSVSSNWSGTWTSRTTFGGDVGDNNGYNLKNELISKPILDPNLNRVYVGIARWLDSTNGDTQSLYYIDSSDNIVLAGNVYSAGGAAWFAPTLDITFNRFDNKLYYFFETSSKDPNSSATSSSYDGQIYYKTYDGSSFSSAQPFFTQNSPYTVDIPIVYKQDVDDKLFLFFRADGTETPYYPPHYIFSGSIPSGGTTTSPTPTPITGTYSATAYTDFSNTCSTLTNSQVTNTSGGETALASSFRDDFETPRSPYTSVFDDLWRYGTYSGGSYSPSPNGSLLVYGSNGAFILGKSSFTKKTLEFRAKFTANAFQHIGFANDESFTTFLMFSTGGAGDAVYARTSNGTTISLGSSYLGSFHTYKIDWGSDIKFYIDGSLATTISENISTALSPMISNNTTSAGSDLTVDWINVLNYPSTTGSYQSCSINSGAADSTWGTVSYNTSTSGSTSVTLKTRTSNDNSSWSAWSSTIGNGGAITSPAGKFIQYLVSFNGITTESPSFDDISFGFSTPTPAPTNTPTPTQTSGSSSSGSNLSSSSSTTGIPSCDAQAPAGVPDLFQIDQTKNTATLYFTSVPHSTYYYIKYGTSSSADQFGVSFSGAQEGVVSYTINSLQPGTTYYFAVRTGNGCAPGKWSSEKSVTTNQGQALTKDIVVDSLDKTFNPTQKMNIISSDLQASKPTVCAYTVKSGDTLWSIAQSQLNDGKKFQDIQILNNLSDVNLSVGQKLKMPCGQDERSIEEAKKQVTQKGIILDVKVVTKTNKPVVGARVTLHSKIQTTVTNTEGIAHFEDVESGNHKVLIAYQNYTGEQSLTVDGSQKQQTLTLKVEMNSGFSSPQVRIVVAVLVLIIISLLSFITYKRYIRKI